jgi:hypothetical protein
VTTLPLSSSKLHALLAQLWSSPVFGNSYPATVNRAHPSVLATIEEVYHATFATLDHVLQLAQPGQPACERDTIVRQVAAKSVAFCGALAAGEIHDVERLRAAASAIGLVSWTDQTMDRGDGAMVTAVELVSGKHAGTERAQTRAVRHYSAALGWFMREVAVLARPEDGPWVLRCLLSDTLAREARMWRLSERYCEANADGFWARHAREIGELTVHDVGFVAVTAMVYAIYRQHQPQLPCLMEVLNNRALLNGPLRAGGAAIRVLDDIGDRVIDSGADPRWGRFTINLWNQDHPRHVAAFLDAAGVEAGPARCAMLAAWAARDHGRLAQLWLDQVRGAYAMLAPRVLARHATFLRLSQRVMEAGLVNALGDDVLAEEPLARAVGA